MVVNVGIYNKAKKPELETPEQVDNTSANLVNMLGRGVVAGMKYATAQRGEELFEQRLVEHEQEQKRKQALLQEHEDKTRALKDFTNFQYDLENKFDELSTNPDANLVKDFDTYYKQALDKRSNGKSIAYRTQLREAAGNYYNQIAGTIVDKASENIKLRTASYLQEAVDNYLSSDTKNVGEIYGADTTFTQAILEMDIPDGLKERLARQNQRAFTKKAVEVMTEQNPEYVATFVDNDERVQNLFDEEQILNFKKQANETLFNRYAEENPVYLEQLMQSDEAKKVFQSLDEKELKTLKEKSKKLLNNYKVEQRRAREENKLNAIMQYQSSQPSMAKYNQLVLDHPNLTTGEKTMLREWTESVIKKGVETINTNLLPQLKQFYNEANNMDIDSEETAQKISDTIMGFRSLLRKANNDEFLSEEDFQEYDSLAVKLANKTFFKYLKDNYEDIKPFLDRGETISLKDYKQFMSLDNKSKRDLFKSRTIEALGFKREEAMAKLSKETIAVWTNLVSEGRTEEARELSTKAKREMANIRYPYLKNLKYGDKFVRNGIVYTLVGMSDTTPIISTENK